jgi:DNA-directed RNA polymerase I, II, and III subunit RPABC1
MQSVQKRKQFQARNTTLEMLQDRGYVIPEKHFDFTFEEFLNIGFYDIYIPNEDESEYTYIHFSKQDKQLTINNLKNIYSNILEETDNIYVHVILILNDEPNSAVKTALKSADFSNIEYFLYEDLIINITKHAIMPRFEIVKDADEVKTILKRYNATKQQLPKFLSTDPIPKYFNAKSGTIFRIAAKSATVGEAIRYRIVR